MGHFQRLASVRESVNRGESLETVIRRQRPPIHFLREQSFKAQVNRWSDERLLVDVTRLEKQVQDRTRVER